MTQLRAIAEIRVLEDRAFTERMVAASGAVIGGGVVAGVLWYGGVSAFAALHGEVLAPFELDAIGSSPVAWGLSLVLVMCMAFIVHELVHGFFFKQFAPPGATVGFGADLAHGVLYATAEGVLYSRQQYLAIVLAPTVVVSLALLAVGIGIKWPLWTLILMTLHLAGCTGDWGYACAIRRDPDIRFCEDTAWGVRFYGVAATGGRDAVVDVEFGDGRGRAGAQVRGRTGAARFGGAGRRSAAHGDGQPAFVVVEGGAGAPPAAGSAAMGGGDAAVTAAEGVAETAPTVVPAAGGPASAAASVASSGPTVASSAMEPVEPVRADSDDAARAAEPDGGAPRHG